MPVHRNVTVYVDLTGSTKLDDGWLSCEVQGKWPWTTERIKEEAATHYGVPVDQIEVVEWS